MRRRRNLGRPRRTDDPRRLVVYVPARTRHALDVHAARLRRGAVPVTLSAIAATALDDYLAAARAAS